MKTPPAAQRGLTLFELAVVLVIVSAAGAVFLDRLHRYQDLAEKAAMETTVTLIKTGLQIRLAELIIANRQGEAARLEIDDPTRWLDPRPANFAGAYRDPPQRGNWYYDAPRRQLVYVVNSGQWLEIDTGNAARELRFQARLLRDRLKIGGATVHSVTGVTVVPVTPFRWSRFEHASTLA
jgi:prepilin-type N-terminal cleavage/methylation domain-containing protein